MPSFSLKSIRVKFRSSDSLTIIPKAESNISMRCSLTMKSVCLTSMHFLISQRTGLILLYPKAYLRRARDMKTR